MKIFADVVKLSLANIELREALEEQVIRDPLTGVFNRRYLNETLPRELSRVARENKSLCLAMIDLDHFKVFNDTHGHEAGDKVLQFVGDLLAKMFRGNDIACRFGGEEFVVILVNTDMERALTRLEDFRDEVKKTQLYHQHVILPQITISVGLAQAPEQATKVDELIRLADEALYAAKKAGRDRIVLSDHPMQKQETINKQA